MAVLLDLTGQSFVFWTVLHRAPDIIRAQKPHVAWICVCRCGTKKAVEAKHLRSGRSASCGCLGLGRGPIAPQEHPAYTQWARLKKNARLESEWTKFAVFVLTYPGEDAQLRVPNEGPVGPATAGWVRIKEPA